MMHFKSYKTFIDTVNNSFLGLATTTLILLFSLNIGWLLMFIRLSYRLNAIKQLGKTILNLESILLMGNLTIIILSVGVALAIKQLKLLVDRH